MLFLHSSHFFRNMKTQFWQHFVLVEHHHSFQMQSRHARNLRGAVHKFLVPSMRMSVIALLLHGRFPFQLRTVSPAPANSWHCICFVRISPIYQQLECEQKAYFVQRVYDIGEAWTWFMPVVQRQINSDSYTYLFEFCVLCYGALFCPISSNQQNREATKKKANVERDRFMRYRRIKIYIHIGLELNEIYVVLFCIQIVWAARPELKAN